MVAHNSMKKSSAKKMAKRLRSKGKDVSIYKKKRGWGVSSTMKK